MEEGKRKDKVSHERGKITQTFGEITFNSNFDSGNLDRIELVVTPPDGHKLNEFNLWTAPDCAGTRYENGNRSWFYFSLATSPNYNGKTIKMTIKNLNKQSRLYQQGLTPLIKILPGKGWERMRDRPEWQVVDNSMELSFTYTPPEGRKTTTYFSFCYPFSYTDSQKHLFKIEQRVSRMLNASSPPLSPPLSPSSLGEDAIYYHRDLLCKSLDGLHVDLLTVSSHKGIAMETEPRLFGLFPDESLPTARQFRNKKIVIITSRVHPGESPASFVFNGFLDFLLRQDDPRAQALLSNFVFKLVPMINPDGVSRGHYRTDSRGVNLNRVYLDPDPNIHPSVYAIRQLVLYYNNNGGGPVGGGSSTESEESTSDGEKVSSSLSSFSSQISSTVPSFTSQSVSDESHPSDQPHPPNEPHPQDKPHPSTKDSSSLKSESRSTLTSKPQGGNIALYVDLHAHATKRGCFMYGNHFKDPSDQSECMLLPKLVSLNSAHFDFEHCLFSERNMYAADRRNEGGGTTKEGSGRVALYKATGLIQCYTLECNYNSGRIVNQLTPAPMDTGRATPPSEGSLIPHKLTSKDFEEVGRGLAIGLLDLYQLNPWSRIPTSEHSTLAGIKNYLHQKILNDRRKGGDTSSFKKYNNRIDRNRSCTKNNSSESVTPPTAPPPPTQPSAIPVITLINEEAMGNGCGLNSQSSTRVESSKYSVMMLNRHFTLPSSAKLHHHGNKDHPLLSASLPSRRQPFIYQKPSTPSPIHLPLVPFTHRMNPYFHPHEGLLMIGTSPLRAGEEQAQKMTTKITSFPQQGGTLDSPFPRGGRNLKPSPLRPTEVFSIMGRNLGQRLYTRSLVIDRCSVDQQNVAEQDSTCTCTCNRPTCTCTGTCNCEDDGKNNGIERGVSTNGSSSNSVSKNSLGRKKTFTKASPLRSKASSRKTLTHPLPSSRSTKLTLLKHTPTPSLSTTKRHLSYK